MKLRLILLALTLALSIPGPFMAAAQEPCPPNLACVEYEGVVLEIDPADGPYQLLIVQVDTIKSEHLSGTNERVTKIYPAGFAEVGPKQFEFDRMYAPREPVGIFKDAELGDTFGLENLGQ